MLIVIGGLLAALHLLGMTEAVLSFLGLAGVVTLAVGFCVPRHCRDHFIASVMLWGASAGSGWATSSRSPGRPAWSSR